MAAFNNVGLTITFCECAENHRAMQQIGTLGKEGYSVSELRQIHQNLTTHGFESHLVDLGAYLPPEYGREEAALLVIRNGARIFVDPVELLWNELIALPYDSKAKMYGRVVDKKARHNLCFADFDQAPDYEAGKGTVFSFARLPFLNHVRTYLPVLAGPKAAGLLAEANLYYDVRATGIGFHSDLERMIVIGLRLGDSFPLVYQWYINSQPIGPRIDFDLKHGDIYIMSEKAVGPDGRKRTIPTLRHAAGAEKYITTKAPKTKKA